MPCGMDSGDNIIIDKDANNSVLIFSRFDNLSQLQLWDLSKCLQKKSVTFPSSYYQPVFDPSGRLLVTQATSYYVWDAKTGKYLYSIPGQVLDTLGFNTDGSQIIVGYSEQDTSGLTSFPATYQLHVIDSESGREQIVISPSGKGLRQILPTRDPSIILVLDSYGLRYINIENGNLVSQIGGTIQALTFSPDKKDIAYVNSFNTIFIIDLESGKTIHTIQTNLTENVNAIHYSSDGSKIAVKYFAENAAPHDFSLGVFDVHSGKLSYKITTDHFWVDFFPDQLLSAIERSDGYVELWDFNQNSPIKTIFGTSSRIVFGTDFSPDENIFVTDNRFWDVKTGQLLQELPLSYSSLGIINMTFSPDGRMIAISNPNGMIDIWGIQK